MPTLGHLASTPAAGALIAAFLGAFVEFVEASTIVLAVGTVRGWRPALIGTGAGIAVLLVLVAALGPALTRIPLAVLQLVIGVLLLLFGMRWLRKAILRAAGLIPLHDEAAAFSTQTSQLRGHARHTGGLIDPIATVTTFKAVVLEGVEVVFIVVGVGAGGGLLWAGQPGAAAAGVLVVVIGLVLHQPLARVPENMLKLAVGTLISAFGIFWVGEGLGVAWPGGDLAILGLVLALLATAWLAVRSVPTGAYRDGRGCGSVKALRTIARELLGLVVDDAGLAIGLLVWCALMAGLIRGLALPGTEAALLLAAGCLLILGASVWQAGRRATRR